MNKNSTSLPVNDLLKRNYTLGSYQRDYKWEKQHIKDLVTDLTDAFFKCYKEEHDPLEVSGYDQYYLGQIVVSNDKESEKYYIVDGQQRLTSLTLILTFLWRLENISDGQKSKLGYLIWEEKHSEKSFRLCNREDLPYRAEILQQLIEHGEEVEDNKDFGWSERNLIERYKDIKKNMDDIFQGQRTVIPLFTDYLVHKVYLVDVQADSTDEAYDIYEKTNDRGLGLKPIDNLKGYLLSRIRDASNKTASNKWNKKINELVKLSKTEDANCIKAWLRGQHAGRHGDGKLKNDFEKIGGSFHRWVRSNAKDMGLINSSKFEKFIMEDFNFYATEYLNLRDFAKNFNSELPEVYYIGECGLDLQFTLLLAAISPPSDRKSMSENIKKLRAVSIYMDIAIHRQMGNNKKGGEAMMRKIMLGENPVITAIRSKSVNEIADILNKKLQAIDKEDEIESTLAHDFALNGRNRPWTHRILARITDYIGTQSGHPPKYPSFFHGGKKGFTVEHIWNIRFDEQRKKEFGHQNDFDSFRNRIGGLLLIQDNSSLSDSPYEKKLKSYIKQNILAQSLHEQCYKKDPNFIRFTDRFKQKTGLEFSAHSQFNKADLEQRQKLYIALADEIWNPERLHDVCK